MKAFNCDSCGSLVFFENVRCVKCNHSLGYLPDIGDLSALEPAVDASFKTLAPRGNDGRYRMCANGQQHQICNWMVKMEDPNPFCLSCQLTKTIPDLKVPGNLERWHKLETAKRRGIYTILQLRLPMGIASENDGPELSFCFLGDTLGKPAVMSGHDQGLITVNIGEADDAERERRRVSLHEPYRTLLGHFRHEIGHYYWDRLVAKTPRLDRFREIFGDETRDYTEALKGHYRDGPPPDWQSHFVSAYASAHPWEDWAETWAHYFHIVDAIETAASFGLILNPRHHPDEGHARLRQIVA